MPHGSNTRAVSDLHAGVVEGAVAVAAQVHEWVFPTFPRLAAVRNRPTPPPLWYVDRPCCRLPQEPLSWLQIRLLSDLCELTIVKRLPRTLLLPMMLLCRSVQQLRTPGWLSQA
jgi:hypothetical protein